MSCWPPPFLGRSQCPWEQTSASLVKPANGRLLGLFPFGLMMEPDSVSRLPAESLPALLSEDGETSRWEGTFEGDRGARKAQSRQMLQVVRRLQGHSSYLPEPTRLSPEADRQMPTLACPPAPLKGLHQCPSPLCLKEAGRWDGTTLCHGVSTWSGGWRRGPEMGQRGGDTKICPVNVLSSPEASQFPPLSCGSVPPPFLVGVQV